MTGVHQVIAGGGARTAKVEQVTSGTGTGTTAVITLPTLLTGRFLWVVLAVNTNTENPTTPSGWAVQWANNPTAEGDEWHAWSKVGDGTEGTTLNITKSSTNFYAYLCFSFVDMDTGTLTSMLANDETSSTPTPNTIFPALYSSAFVTFLTGGQETVSAYPPSTPLFRTATTGGTSAQPMLAMAVAHVPPQLSSFSPGDWTMGASDPFTMRTIAIGNV